MRPSIKNYLVKLILFTIASFAVVGIRILRPIIRVRVGPLVSNRLGHFSGNTEIHLCERDLGMHPRRSLDFFYHGAPVCNNQLATMWERTINISTFARYVDRINRRIPGGKVCTIDWPRGDRDINGVVANTSAHLSFTGEEEQAGQLGLQKLGIPEGVPFVCMHSRDSAYLHEQYPQLDLSYHDFRDSTISNFLPAAKELVSRGYYVVRTGASVNEPITESIPGVIDYATIGRSDFMDIYLGANCSFYLGDSCGFHSIPMIFRRPLAIVNMVPIEHAPMWMANCAFIPKKHWLQDEDRALTFKEIIDHGIGKFLRTEQFKQAGLEVIENTSEEIKASAMEAVERLEGTWQCTDEDEFRQTEFWKNFVPNELNQVYRVRIGREYLRQNPELLNQ